MLFVTATRCDSVWSHCSFLPACQVEYRNVCDCVCPTGRVRAGSKVAVNIMTWVGGGSSPHILTSWALFMKWNKNVYCGKHANWSVCLSVAEYRWLKGSWSLARQAVRKSTIQNYQRDALNITYSSNIITLLYMFRVSSTYLQEDIVVHKQHMVPSLSIRVLVSCWYAAIGSYSCISTRY